MNNINDIKDLDNVDNAYNVDPYLHELRDRIAISALSICLNKQSEPSEQNLKLAASLAYKIADFMLKERGKAQ